MDSSIIREFVAAIGGVVVFLMQAGFGMLQVGGVQSSKARLMFMKNVLDISIAAIAWWLVGYGIAYGKDISVFIGTTQYGSKGLDEYTNWFSSFVLCTIGMAIVSASLAERINFRAHLIASILFAAIIYPFIVHWAWGDGWASPYRSYLREELLAGCGVIDFAGSGVIHMTGGLTALILSKMSLPREGRFSVLFQYPAYSSIFQSLGTLLIWFSWYGLIAVSSRSVESDDHWGSVLGRAMSTTSLAAAAACVTSVLLGQIVNGQVLLQLCNNGALSGLVAISASCATCTMYGAFIIGIVAGFVNYYSSILIGFIEVDDVTDAIPVHFFSGMWGLVAAGLFTTQENYEEAYTKLYKHSDGAPFSRSHHCAGVFYGGDGNQLAANLCYVFAIFAWAGALSFIVFYVLENVVGLRMENNSRRGMDNSERGSQERDALMMT